MGEVNPVDRLPRFTAARAAFKGHEGKGFPKGKGRSGVWVTIGPSEAVYPFFPLRTSSLYVPNEYVAGGRTTSMALGGDCDQFVRHSPQTGIRKLILYPIPQRREGLDDLRFVELPEFRGRHRLVDIVVTVAWPLCCAVNVRGAIAEQKRTAR